MPTRPHASQSDPILGTIDGFSLPATIRGWVCHREHGTYRDDLRIELRRGGERLLDARPTGPRADVTQDREALVAFEMELAGIASLAELMEGTCRIIATDGTGDVVDVEFYEPTLRKLRATLGRAADAGAAAVPGLMAVHRLLQALDETDPQPRPETDRPRPARRSARRAVITLIGAGSTVFSKNLIGDILLEPALADSAIRLHDIDPARLGESETVARRIVSELGVSATVEATTELDRALDGADFAINTIQVGGYRPATVTDFAIPNRFGLRQTIGDTLGIGGIMRALRTVPVLLRMAEEMRRRCPDVLHLNYSNPMAMNCWALSRAVSTIRTVGLCHSVQTTLAELAADIGVDPAHITYQVAGINHMAFFLRFESDGQDLYPLIRAVSAENRVPAHNRVRYDVLDRFGYFVTESSEHFAEYVPWYIKQSRKELVGRFNIPLDEYPRRCEQQIADWAEQGRALADPSQPLTIRRSHEYGARIIHAVRTGEPAVIYGNVPNDSLIDNLPGDCCVEVPCLVDGSGLQPTRVGRLPVQLAALMQSNVNVQALAVEAALTGRREHVYQAAMLDPHTAAELDLDQIHRLVDELLAAHRPWLPETLFD